MTQAEWNKLISGRISADTSIGIADNIETNLVAEKAKRLAEATELKLKRLNTKYTPDTLNAMYDADTVSTKNLGYAREVDPYGNRYDAVETKHGDNAYDMNGRDGNWFTNLFHSGPSKSTYAMERQREQVAGIFGKEANDVTEQDMLDVANQQQIQKLADLARTKGEDRWVAPLIKGSEQVNLAPTDEKGELIPLNVPIMSQDMGAIGVRGGAALANTANEEVSAQAAIDPLQNAFAEEANMSELQKFRAKYANREEKSSLGNALSAFGYTLGEGVISTIDLVPEMVEYAYKNITGDGQAWSDTEGMYTKESADAFKEWTGYNEKVMSQLGEKAVKSVKNAWERGDYLGLAKTVWEGITTPELAGSSLGYVVGLVLPGTGAKRVVDAVKGVTKAAKALKASNQGMTTTQAMKIAGDKAGPGYKIANIIAGNVGYAGGAEVFARDAEELYKTTYNEEMPTEQKLLARVGGLLFTKMDAGMAKAIVIGKDPVAKMVPQMIKSLPDAMKVNLMGKIAVSSGATAARVTGAFGLEALTEGVQTSMEKVAGLYKEGEKGIGDVLDEQKYEIGGGSLLGGAGGAQMTAPTTAKQIVDVVKPVETLKKGIERVTETPVQKKQREIREYSTPIQEEAITAAMTNTPEEVSSRVEKLHGKLDTLDSSANKKRTYGTILKNSLERAVKSGDEAAVENVYKTMAELDKSDADFNMEDMVKDFAYSATKDFLTAINKNQDTTTSKMQDLKNKATGEVTEKATERENILAEVKQIEALIELEEKRLKNSMGSEDFDSTIGELTKLKNTVKSYIEGKDLTAVNSEFAELGFIVAEDGKGLKADPNRPGLAVYRKELEDQLLNTKTNSNLLNSKVVNSSGVVTLTGLTKFAESRLKKLDKTDKKEAFQTSGLIDGLIKENEEMIITISELSKVASGLKDLDKDTKDKYKAELTKAAKSAITANKELVRRKEILDSVEGKGSFAFQVELDGSETIQKFTGKDANGKFTKAKVADVVEDKAVMVEPTKDKVKDSAVQKVKKVIKKNLESPEALTKEDEQLIENAKEDGTLAEANKELVEEVKGSRADKGVNKEDYYASGTKPKVEPKEASKIPPKGPLGDVRVRIAYVNEELSKLIASVPDMDVKQHVKDHYNKKLEELQTDRTKLNGLIDRLEVTLNKRIARKYKHKDLKLITAIVAQIDRLVSKMLHQINRLHKLLKKTNKRYGRLATEMKTILQEIKDIEKDFTSEPVKTTIGIVTKIDEELYGKPVIEVGDKRIVAKKRVNEKTGKPVTQATAINDALELVKEDKLTELRNELKELPKGETSLSAKLLGRVLSNFKMSSPIHRIVSRGNDSVFGKISSNTFADTDKLLEVLPKGFKEFFASDAESRQELRTNIETMAEYIKTAELGDIKIGKNVIKNNITQSGLVMLNRPNPEGGEYNFPVEMLELIGTVKDGKLEIDEQTQNILKFYSAKMLSDSQVMIGKILSFDESEMSQYLGITDPEEQMQVKQEAREGYVNSASIRKDIGSEVYQAIGLKLNRNTPEFTEESFKSSLGVLVQAIAIDNGSMATKAMKAGDKNQNLVKVNWDNLKVEKEPLIKSINKLQYMNESRNRPLPSFKKPRDNDNRMVMNTQNPIDKKSTEFLNKQEKIAYTISPRLQRWLDMDEDKVLKAMGYTDIETAGLHVSEVDAQIARNDKLVREWDILKVFAKATKNKKFYLNWGQTVSGRFTILNDIQYQESKLHREFVVAEGSVESVDPKSVDGRQMLEASIMQGLDMDPDKLSAETATENFNEVFKITDKGVEVTKEGPIKTAYEAMQKGEIDAEALGEVFADSEGHHGISSIELLVDWDKALKNGTKIETHANLEIDAITSGMILTLLQIGSDAAIGLAEKGGIYTEVRRDELEAYVKGWLGKDVEFTPGALIEAGKKHAAEIEEKMKTAKGAELVALRKELEDDSVFKDLYSTIGVAMIGEVTAYKAKLESIEKPSESEIQQLAMLNQIGELNLKNIRSIAKSPVMVYIYGATTNSIKKKLTYSLGVDTLVKAIKSASKKLKKDPKTRPEEMDFIKLFVDQDKIKYVDGNGFELAEENVPKEAWSKLLAMDIEDSIPAIEEVIKATFGAAIETAFESRLGFVDKNRDAIKTLEILTFEAYQIRFADEVKTLLDSKYGEGRHKGESYKLSKEDLVEINAKLTNQGYGHNIVWDEEGTRINQSLNKTGTKGGEHSTNVTVGNTKVGGQIKQFKPLVNTGAASTIPIHAIDGRMMLDVLGRELDGKYAGGNVYDAVVLSLNKAMLTDTADSYNTNMIETGFGRSIVADQLGMVENMLSTMNDDQKKRMFANIGLRPEGELREDYTKEANRLNLGIGKMLERIELAEEVNQERLANSGKGYYSGHLFQMGSGLVKIDGANARAKEFPVIDTLKTLLRNKLEADRKVTQKEFGGKLDKRANYVFNLNDIANMKSLVDTKKLNSVDSKANVIELGLSKKKKPTVKNSFVDSLSSNDVVEVIGSYKPKERTSESYWFNEIRKQILDSDAGIISRVGLSTEGRVSENGVWVKQKKDALVEPTIGIGFQGHVGGFDSKGKGTPQGDGKDKAMREIADGFIGEVSLGGKNHYNTTIEKSPTSTATSWNTIAPKGGGRGPKYETFNEYNRAVLESGELLPVITMLARNGALAKTELTRETKKRVLRHFSAGATFVVGDMPGVDTQFIDYLDELGASYKIYHTGSTSRIQKDEGTKASVQENVDTIVLEETNRLVADGVIPSSAKNRLVKGSKVMIAKMSPEEQLNTKLVQEKIVKMAAKLGGKDPEQTVVEHIITEEQDEKLSKEYTEVFKKINKEFIRAVVKVDKEFLLDGIRVDVNEFVPGGYKPKKHSVHVVSKEVSKLELELAAGIGYDAKYLDRLKETNPIEVVHAVGESAEYKELKKGYLEKRVAKLAEDVDKLDESHTLVHELVHAAEYLFMEKKNKTAKEKKVADRLELLFEETKKRKGYKEYTTDSPYWTKDVHEFIAEALSNPKFIRELDAMPTYNRYNKLSTVLRAIVDALVSIVSTKKNKESVYAYVLDGLMALIEVDKQDLIVLPSEAFTKNVKNKIKC